jgi:hypothetical protein
MIIKFQSENPKGRDHIGDSRVRVKILLKWILKRQDMRVWTRLTRFLDRDQSMTSLCQHEDETLSDY